MSDIMDEFMRKEKFENPVKAEELRNELTLNFDNFKQPMIKKDYHALAKAILNLILLEPGTYPDTPEMGVNIAQYQFEFLTDETINTIQQAIQAQVNLYIPSNNIQRIIVARNTNKVTGKKELIVGFAVGIINDADGSLTSENFFIRLANNEFSGITSSIIA